MLKVLRKKEFIDQLELLGRLLTAGGVVAAVAGVSVVSSVGVIGGSVAVFKYRKDITKWLRAVRHPAETDCNNLTPTGADFLLCLFLSRHNRKQIIGDLTEEFHEDILPKFGVKAARIWYWKKALGAILERNPISRRILVGSGFLKVGEWLWKTFAG